MSFEFHVAPDGSLPVITAVHQAVMEAAQRGGNANPGEDVSPYVSDISQALEEFVRLNPEGIAPVSPGAHAGLALAARKIAQACRVAFPGADPQLQQAMCFVEELGEFQGAARRYLGLARREGNPRELAEELADVIIVAYVSAEVFGISVNEAYSLPETDVSAEGAVWGLMAHGAFAIREMDRRMNDRPNDLQTYLSAAVAAARHAGAVLDIDLNEEIAAKHEKIFTRGWRDGAPKLTSVPMAME